MSDSYVLLSVPHIDGNEWAYVKECLDTGWVSSVGAFVDRFEAEFAKRVGTAAAVACASGTAALHVALLLAGVTSGDEVVVSTLTFIAPANAVTYVGAVPVFVDAEPNHFQLDVDKLRDFFEQGCSYKDGALRNKATGRRVAAIVPVHVVGHPCDMAPLLELAERYGLPVIEDSTEALGSTYQGRPAGSLGRIGCFSFNGNKILTTGGGGMLVTDDLELARRAKYLTTQAKDDAIEFVHGAVGYNYRLSNVAAAIGVAQLEQLDRFVEKKRALALRYDEAFSALPGVSVPSDAPWAQSNKWLYTLRFDEKLHSSRAIMQALRERRIESRPLWQPMHKSPAHPGAFSWRCDQADVLQRECLSIPCSTGLTDDEQLRVIQAIAALVHGGSST